MTNEDLLKHIRAIPLVKEALEQDLEICLTVTVVVGVEDARFWTDLFCARDHEFHGIVADGDFLHYTRPQVDESRTRLSVECCLMGDATVDIFIPSSVVFEGYILKQDGTVIPRDDDDCIDLLELNEDL